MRRASVLALCAMLLFASASWSKGQTVRIEIDGDGLSDPIVIADPKILDQFNIWNGPGVRTSGPDGVPHPPAYLDPNQSAGRFIDWPRGQASKRPSGLQRLEVTFFVGLPTEPGLSRSYVFAYEVDTSESHGFIYLPMWMNNLISHGVEGNWFHSSKRWNEVIGPIIANHTTDLPPLSERPELKCIAGHGSVKKDGTIEFMLVDEDGTKLSHWRYATTTTEYNRVRQHIGDVEPNEEIEVSCWPPRS